jgi:hypothetical protein
MKITDVIDDGSGQLRPSLTPKTYHHQGKHSTINWQWCGLGAEHHHQPVVHTMVDSGGNIDQSVAML